MRALRFDVLLDDPPGFRADAVLGDAIFEVLIEPRDLRKLRASLLDIARFSAGKPERRGILVLADPQISESRLSDEWTGARAVIRPEVFKRLAMVVCHDGKPPQTDESLTPEERDHIAAVVEHERGHAVHKVGGRSEAFFDILRPLLIAWFRGSGPLTSKELSAQTGFSYPTISNALRELEPYLVRHSDRRVELRAFPKDAWFRLVAQAENVRSTMAFADPSMRPRSPEVLLQRLRELKRSDIAVGGVLGARHYLPGLDLVGTPRLDLVVHNPRPEGSHEFLRKLDPALQPAKRGEPARVFVHTLCRPVAFFQKGDDGMVWADEVECLLDLHEARLESQALEFLERLTPRSKP
ncbi:MAG: hypothetical protein Q8Q59_01835 [Luteolibacter sp.]|nr:hypothetical protein [Luteolibacter sp.]